MVSSLKVQLPNSNGKLYTVMGMTQAWDQLTFTVENENGSTFVFSKDNHQKVRVLQTKGADGADGWYGTDRAASNTFIITATDNTTMQPVSLVSSITSVSFNGVEMVHTLTVVGEDHPNNPEMVDYNDIYLSLTWYDRAG